MADGEGEASVCSSSGDGDVAESDEGEGLGLAGVSICTVALRSLKTFCLSLPSKVQRVKVIALWEQAPAAKMRLPLNRQSSSVTAARSADFPFTPATAPRPLF